MVIATRADPGENNGSGAILKTDWAHRNDENQTKYWGTTHCTLWYAVLYKPTISLPFNGSACSGV